MILNANMLLPILRLANLQYNHRFLSLLDPIKAFVSDYIGFKMRLQRHMSGVRVTFEFSTIFHLNLFDDVFVTFTDLERRMLRAPLNRVSKVVVNGQEKDISGKPIDLTGLRDLLWESSLERFKERVQTRRRLGAKMTLQKSFVHLKNAYFLSLVRFDVLKPIHEQKGLRGGTTGALALQLNLIFSISEEPLLSESYIQHGEDRIPLMDVAEIEIFTRPHASRQGDGSLNVRVDMLMEWAECEVVVPFFQKFRSFQEADSDQSIHYMIPASFVLVLGPGSNEKVILYNFDFLKS